VHGVEFGEGLLILLVLYVAEHAIMPEPTVLWVVPQCLRIVADGFRKLVLLDACQASQFIEVDDIGIALDGLRAVALGTRVIVKVVLGHASEEPGLVEIGLGRDGLVEVLDGEHIVLVVEG